MTNPNKTLSVALAWCIALLLASTFVASWGCCPPSSCEPEQVLDEPTIEPAEPEQSVVVPALTKDDVAKIIDAKLAKLPKAEAASCPLAPTLEEFKALQKQVQTIDDRCPCGKATKDVSPFFDSARLSIFGFADIDRQGVVYVGQRDNKPVCTAFVKDGKLEDLSTEQNFRRQGYATEFVQAIEKTNGKLDLTPLTRTPEGMAFVDAYKAPKPKAAPQSATPRTDAAIESARAANKTLLILFVQPDCPSCPSTEAALEADHGDNALLVLDREKDAEFARARDRFGVTRTPTIIRYLPNVGGRSVSLGDVLGTFEPRRGLFKGR